MRTSAPIQNTHARLLIKRSRAVACMILYIYIVTGDGLNDLQHRQAFCATISPSAVHHPREPIGGSKHKDSPYTLLAMPQNITLDDRSPLITYYGNWTANYKQIPLNDAMSERYYASTFHYSESSGDSVKVKFNGTAVYIYGAKRPNRGHYTVSVDNGERMRFDAYAPDQPSGDNGLFRQLLFSQANLNDQLHEITLTNDSHEGDGRPSVDIDYVTWTSSVDSHAGTNDFDDGHPNWSFNGSWDKRTLDPTNNQTGHSTRTLSLGSSAIFTFQGDAIYLYGAVAKGHGSYNITLDDREPIALNGFYTRLYTDTILFFADSLGSGSHTLIAINTENKVFAIDFARVFQSKNTSGTPASTHTPGPRRIVIAAVCGVLVLILLGFMVWYIRRKRQNKLDPMNLINPTSELREMPPPGYEPASAGPGWYIQEPVPRRYTRPGRKERKIDPSLVVFLSRRQEHNEDDLTTSYEWSSASSEMIEPVMPVSGAQSHQIHLKR